MLRSLLAAFTFLAAAPVHAEVVAVADSGFVVRRVAEVTASPEQVWAELVKPAAWWNGKHTYSGNAANLSLDPLAMGCFCEVLPSTTSPRAAPRGSVEHMRVINAEQPRVLRMVGALGPLQAEPVQGTLTIVLRPGGGGTLILWEYVVGGYMRQKPEQMGAVADSVLGEQISRLAAKLGPKAPPAPAAPAPRPKPVKPEEGR